MKKNKKVSLVGIPIITTSSIVKNNNFNLDLN